MNVTEKQLQNTCSEYLELDGWRRIKMDPVSDASRGKGFGELGMSDDIYIRYANDNPYLRTPAGLRGDQPDFKPRQWAEVMWIEWKRPKGDTGTGPCRKCGLRPGDAGSAGPCGRNGAHNFARPRAGKASKHQAEWIAAERARGALVLLAGVTFPATIEGFQKWYLASGLARRVR